MASRGSDIAERKRAALLRAALVLGVFFLYPLLATFTPVLDGTVARVSVALPRRLPGADVRADRGADLRRSRS